MMTCLHRWQATAGYANDIVTSRNKNAEKKGIYTVHSDIAA